MSNRTFGIALIIIGAVIALASAISDLFGSGVFTGIGWKQLLGVVIGIYISLIGFWQLVSKPKVAN